MADMKQFETLLRQVETFEALSRLKDNPDFAVFLAELRDAERVMQAAYNDADLTKPIPTAELKGQLKSLQVLLKQLDTSETVVQQSRHDLERLASENKQGGGGRHPISGAIRPRGD